MGNSADAWNRKQITKTGISGVLNCTREIGIPDFYIQDSIKFSKLELLDGYPIPREKIEQAINFLSELHEKNHEKVLVHCAEGVSRSPTITFAYLLHLDFDPVEAWSIIKEARPIVFPAPVMFYSVFLYFNLDYKEWMPRVDPFIARFDETLYFE